ncbi:MAG: hypothetical protein WC807_03005 [Hyphomicrobium sp.]|jgi:hypothetical protein
MKLKTFLQSQTLGRLCARTSEAKPHLLEQNWLEQNWLEQNWLEQRRCRDPRKPVSAASARAVSL